MTPSLRELDLREYGDWPRSHRAAACVLLALLVFGLPWALLTRPTSAQWQTLKSAEHDTQTRLQQSRQQVDTLPALPPFLPDEPPPPTNLPALITTIAETAQTAGLHGGQFRPTSPTATDAPTDAIAIELRLHGTWPQLARFAAALATLKTDALLSLRDIRLRAQPQAAASTPLQGPLLELSATVLMYPRPSFQPIPVPASRTNAGVQRNPFIDSTTRSRQSNPHSVIGSLGHGREQVGLVLTADGELRRVRGSKASHSTSDQRDEK